MRLSEAAAILPKFIQANLPVLLVGKPGLGKTDIVRQAAEQLQAKLVVTYAGLADPTDAKGFPWIAPDAQHATFVPFGETMEVINFKPNKEFKRVIWFWDDLGQGSPAVQAGFMPWALARRVNGHVLPKEASIVAATNRREDRSGVSGILEAVKSRFPEIQELQSHMDDWGPWAASNDVAPEIIALLRFRPDLLHKFEPQAEIVNQPCPRTWKFASDVFKLGFDMRQLPAVIAGAVGQGAAAEFMGYLRIWKEMPDLDQIIANPAGAPVPTQPATLWAVVTGLASKATATNFPKIAIYSERLMKAGQEEFGVVLARDSVRREKKVEQTPAWQKLMLTDVGRLIAGEY